MKTTRSTIIALLSILLAMPAIAQVDVCLMGRSQFVAFDSEDRILSFEPVSFKPKYGWMGMPKPKVTKTPRGARYEYEQDKGNLKWNILVESAEKSLAIKPAVTASVDFPLTYLSYGFQPESSLSGGKVRLTTENGETTEIVIPIPPSRAPGNVNKLEFFDDGDGLAATVKFADPADLHVDGNIRVILARDKIAEGQTAQNDFTLTFEREAKLYATLSDYPPQTDHSDWFAFEPENNALPGELGMQDWLGLPDAPLESKDGVLLKDGKPFKVWGTNVEYADCAPPEEEARERAAFFAKWGVNGVRLHKLTNPGWEGLGSRNSASEYDPDSLDRFDFFLAQLRERGIVYGFSPIWDLMIFEGDRDKLVAYDEIKKAGGKTTTKGLVWFAKDVQDLHIETLVNLVGHKNPYTGLRYADDPALAYVEIQNEEDVFFYTTLPNVMKFPTYHRMLAGQFSDWLKAKYGSGQTLRERWGEGAFDAFSVREGAFPDESLEKRNIVPVANPWMWDNQGKSGPRAKRLQDTALFFFEIQNNYYQRVEKALSEIGYRGLLEGSNWQAGSTTGHFLNLASDAMVGLVDRHNYQGGAKGNPAHLVLDGHPFANTTMLNDPGSGLLSVGMQQVAGKPFAYSEWLAVVPSEYAAADTALVAMYGFGLQDWDMSYHFASNGQGFSNTLNHPQNKKFNNLTPVGFGLYPVLSRMLQRGDVKAADPIAVRRLTIDQAARQTYDFENTTVQEHDVKSFSGTPSHNALAVGRVLIDFVDEARDSTINEWKQARENDTLVSSTGQLKWTTPGGKKSGYVSVNTPGTQGVLGFCGNRSFALDDLAISTTNPYCVILATAKSQNETLASDKQVLVTAMARVHNTGMNLNDMFVFQVGEGPMILEPVEANLDFQGREGEVIVLDHDGIPTDRRYRLENGRFQLDTGRDQSPFYVVQFD